MTGENWVVVLGALAGGLFGFLGTLLASMMNRRKNRAETNKIIAETDATRIDLQDKLQEQVAELISENRKLFRQVTEEREAKRKELDRVHVDIELMRQELLTVNLVKGGLLTQIALLQAENTEKTKRIVELESLAKHNEAENVKFNAEIAALKRVTGKLSSR